eukprot:Blabericola_migrator_1__250@NODE_1066_length_5548_cov_131_717570_g316_i1_p3_GENE_NODE_1066_length_5548_cov_131_717570_g316_i1NODE_1066_length_5548_cov_131_717570_g316_i1_p3_ORF_typecomplete_len238_score32_58_NODE_1066_length_5548_cov_131_717570_g316_i189802
MFDEGIHTYELTPADRHKAAMLGLALAWLGLIASTCMIYISAVRWAAGHYVNGIIGVLIEICLGAELVSFGATSDRASPAWREASFSCMQGFLLCFLIVFQSLELNWWLLQSIGIDNGKAPLDGSETFWQGAFENKGKDTLFPIAVSCAASAGAAALCLVAYASCLFRVVQIHCSYDMPRAHPMQSIMYMEVPVDLMVRIQATPPEPPTTVAAESTRSVADQSAAQVTPAPPRAVPV